MTSRPAPLRKESADVEFPAATWTSFDRYSRYGAIVRAIRANLGSEPIRVLDVGDDSGWLGLFDLDGTSISVDVNINPERLEEATYVVGDGARLPVRDRSFDVVVSSDALEHVAPESRREFLGELARVSDLVVVAAPFDTFGVAGTEEFVRRYVAASLGASQPQLEEHAQLGLPSLDDAAEALRDAGLDVVTFGNGNLQDWLLGMVVKHQLGGRPELGELNIGFDALYNMLLAGRNEVPPYYRHIVVGRRGVAAVNAGRPTSPANLTETAAVYAAVMSATLSELSRRELAQRADTLEMQHQVTAEHLMARFSGVEAALAGLQSSVLTMQNQLQSGRDLLRHPFRALGRRRDRDGSDE
ncbi:MAG: hypothetical protein QOD92_2548 [Acidimicrobiaceae bacterium]|jgi:hypothetical protein